MLGQSQQQPSRAAQNSLPGKRVRTESTAHISPVCLTACLTVCLTVCLTAYLPVCLTAYLTACLSVWPSVWLLIWLSDYLSVFLSACLCISMTVCLSACLSDCLSFFPSQVRNAWPFLLIHYFLFCTELPYFAALCPNILIFIYCQISSFFFILIYKQSSFPFIYLCK